MAPSFIPRTSISSTDGTFVTTAQEHRLIDGIWAGDQREMEEYWERRIHTYNIIRHDAWPRDDQPARLEQTPEQRRRCHEYFQGESPHSDGITQYQSDTVTPKSSNDPADDIGVALNRYHSVARKRSYPSIPEGSDLDLSSDSYPYDEELSADEEEKQIIETNKIIPALRARPKISAPSLAISELINRGRHLEALKQALEDAYQHTFATDPTAAFSASIALCTLHRSKKDVPVIVVRFRRILNFAFRKWLARGLLSAVLIRYPSGYIPRLFGVVEVAAGQIVVLQGYIALGDRAEKYERCSACRHPVIEE